MVEMVGVVSSVVAVLALIVAALGYVRNRNKDLNGEGRQAGSVLVEIGYIKSGVDDIKRKQDETEKQFQGFADRLARVEESSKSAHHRLDELARR